MGLVPRFCEDRLIVLRNGSKRLLYYYRCYPSLMSTAHGGMQRGGRGHGRNSGSRNNKDVLKFDGDYDFEEANAKFEKDKIVDELSQKLKISE